MDVNTDASGCRGAFCTISACKGEKCVCAKGVCSCGEQGSGPCRPRPPSVNWKRRLLSQHQGSNQRPVSETKRDFIGVNLNHRRLKSSLFVKII